MDAISLLALLGMLLTGLALKTIEHTLYTRKDRAKQRELMAPPPSIILPSSIQKAEDLVWFETVMQMAGMENVPVISTCDCGFAEECYMHCNHNLNDGKCPGHAYRPPMRVKSPMAKQTPDLVAWSGKFEPVKRSYEEIVETEHRKRTLPDTEVQRFRQRMIDNRNAKLKAEFESTKKVRGTPFEEMNALRHRMDDRQREISELKRQLKEIAVKPPRPQYISQPTTYDPVLDCYTVYGKKISRHMLEDLIYNGGLTPQQVREIIAPEVEYETVYGDDGMCYPVRVSPPDTSWVKTERV